jgi:hypothetical protein
MEQFRHVLGIAHRLDPKRQFGTDVFAISEQLSNPKIDYDLKKKLST